MRQRTVGASQYTVEPGFSAAASFDVCATANLTFGLRHGIRMTGIYNRRHFMTLADHEWNRSRRYGRPLSFLMIDIDFFKSINDRFGHEVGDLSLNVPPWDELHEFSPQELHLTGLVTTDAVADVLAERRETDPAVASLTPKSVHDRLVSSADDGKIPPAPKSTKTAEAALPAGGVAAAVPSPK